MNENKSEDAELNSIATRILKERKRLGLTQSEVGDSLDVTYKSVARWEKGGEIGASKLSALAEMGFNIDYILFGKKSAMTRFKQAVEDELIETVAAFNGFNLTDPQKRPTDGHVQILESNKISGIESRSVQPSDISTDNYAHIPLYDVAVSAGSGRLLDHDNILTHLAFTKRSLHRRFLNEKNLICVQVSGDSMQPTLFESDTVMVDITQTEPTGALYVLRVGANFYIKRLVREANHLVVISDNKELYRDWTLSETDDFQIIGKMVWFARYI